jgi:hypothetical protein
VVADRTGSARSVRLYLDPASEASELGLALYGDGMWEEPGALLAEGHNPNLLAGGWNAVELQTPVALVAGQAYWIGLLNPVGSSGPLRWRDRAGDVGTAERVSLSTTLGAFPASWASSAAWWDGPLSAAVWGLPAEAAPDPEPTATPSPEPAATATVQPAAPTPAPEPPRPAAPGPVKAWGFDEPRTNRGIGPRSVAGRFGRALAFNGRQSLALRATRPRAALTVGAWVRPEGRTGTVAAQGTWSLTPREVTVNRRAARGTLTLRRWSHLALVYDGKTIRRYVDGRPAGTRAYAGALGGGSTLRIGDGYRGRLDELRLYDRALTAAEIGADMRRPTSGGQTSLRREPSSRATSAA